MSTSNWRGLSQRQSHVRPAILDSWVLLGSLHFSCSNQLFYALTGHCAPGEAQRLLGQGDGVRKIKYPEEDINKRSEQPKAQIREKEFGPVLTKSLAFSASFLGSVFSLTSG